MAHEIVDPALPRTRAAVPESTGRPDSQRLYAAALARILQRISDHGSATIAELVDIAGVSRPTVQRALAELEQLGVIDQAELRASGTGRPARSWVPRTGARLVMALDIRREESRLVLAGLTGRVVVDEVFGHQALLAEAERSAAGGPPADGIPELVLRRVAARLAAAGIAGTDVVEAVIGVSGIVADDGTILLSTNVPGLTGYPVGRRAVELVGLPSVTVENDMNLRAVGELHAGIARGLSSFVYLTNHTFHRPAVVLGGALWHGHHRTVGEGDQLTRSGVISPRLTLDGHSVEYFDVAGGIDSGALDRAWLELLNDQLAKVIAVLCYVLDPEAVLVHGGPVTTGPAAIADLQDRFLGYTVTDSAPHLLAAGHGSELTISGALVLALKQALGTTLGMPDPPVPRIHGAPS
ncbi:ROK family transcriptional regulator [Brachybacterium sp.]|uniref:ROK family transcriptional regulator n=1 Tax=Brachybacterium sp. TaxID=1891286 RepID=UPI002ED031AE